MTNSCVLVEPGMPPAEMAVLRRFPCFRYFSPGGPLHCRILIETSDIIAERESTTKETNDAEEADSQEACNPKSLAADSGQPIFGQPKPSPDPSGFKDPVTDQKLKELTTLGAVPSQRVALPNPF